MKELSIIQMELGLQEMKRLQEEHPKANVTFDSEAQRINITYPLPPEYWEIKDIKFNEK